MIRRPPRSTRPDTLFPYTTLFRSRSDGLCVFGVIADLAQRLFDFVAQCLRLRGICRLAAINGTGDQLFGNRQLLLKYLRLLALSQQAQGKYVGPGHVGRKRVVECKSVSVRVALGGRPITKKKKNK